MSVCVSTSPPSTRLSMTTLLTRDHPDMLLRFPHSLLKMGPCISSLLQPTMCSSGDLSSSNSSNQPHLATDHRRFGGYALTHNHWEKEMKALEADLVYDRHRYQQGQYYTAGYNSPWKLHHRFVLKTLNPGEPWRMFLFRRNEVWMQCLEPVQPLEDKKKF